MPTISYENFIFLNLQFTTKYGFRKFEDYGKTILHKALSSISHINSNTLILT